MNQCQHPDGCPRPARTRGWCGGHYERVRQSGHPGPVQIGGWSTAELIAEIELLFDTSTADQIADRVGMTLGAIARRLARAGRHDLGRPFYSAHGRAMRAAA